MGLAAEVLPTGLLVRAAVDLLAELVLQVTGRITDSDFNPYHAFESSWQPSLCQDSTRFFVRFSCVMRRRGDACARSH